MDDDVAELATLRRRAYGPDADIDGDPAALARLEHLEAQARLARLARVSPPAAEVTAPAADAGGGLSPADAAPLPSAPVAEAPPEVTAGAVRQTARYVWGFGIVAAVAIAAAVVVPQSADAPGPTPNQPAVDAVPADARVRASDTSETRLIDIPLDRSLARYVEQPSPPAFPLEGGLSWAESLGPHYGWTLWLARSADREERCILLERQQKTYARCQRDDAFLDGDLHVSVPFGDVDPGYRPERMTAGQSLIYRWTAGRGVTIALDQADITYFGDRD